MKAVCKSVCILTCTCLCFVCKSNELRVSAPLLEAPSTRQAYMAIFNQEVQEPTKKSISLDNRQPNTTPPIQDPNIHSLDFGSYFKRANTFYEAQDYDQALEYYKKAIAINSNSCALHHNIGLCMKKKGSIEQAIEHFKIATELNPDYTRAYIQWGILEAKRKNTQKATQLFEHAYRLDPCDTTLLRELGCLYRNQNKYDEAIQLFSKAHELAPDSIPHILELANTLTMLDKYEQALALYKLALRYNPKLSHALHNIGYILKRQGDIDNSIEMFKKVLAYNPDDAKSHFSLALCYLTQGNFQQGWSEYEWRWQTYNEQKPLVANKPYWDGQNIQDKTIIVIAEQGLGDTFQFIRYAKVLHDAGAHVIALVQKPIKTIIQQGCPYLDKVITRGDHIPPCDYQIPLMSIPCILKTSLNTIPHEIPYINADTTLVTYWHKRIKSDTFNIGICWQGNCHYQNQALQMAVAKKSICVSTFLPLTQVPNCSFYSLQKIDGTEELNTTPNNFFVDFGHEVDEKNGRFMDTAAIIMNLDLIITVDTSIAHLAAALGKPTWIVLPNPADWRWLLQRTDSPWYPHIRLFRQKNSGDWQTVIPEVVDALRMLVAAQQTQTPVQTNNRPAQTDQAPSINHRHMRLGQLADIITQTKLCTDQYLATKSDSDNTAIFTQLCHVIPALQEYFDSLLSCNQLLYKLETSFKKHTAIFEPGSQELMDQIILLVKLKKKLIRNINQLEKNYDQKYVEQGS